MSEPDNILYQTFTYKPKDWWEIIADYRYSRFSTNSVGNFASVVGHRHQPDCLPRPITSTTPSSGHGLLCLAGWPE